MSSDSDGYDDYGSGGNEYEEYGGGQDQAECFQDIDDQLAQYQEDQAELFQDIDDQLAQYQEDQAELFQDIDDQLTQYQEDQVECFQGFEDKLAEYHGDQAEFEEEWELGETDELGKTDEGELDFGGGFFIPPLYSTGASYLASSRLPQCESTIKEAEELMKPILDNKSTYKALLRTTGGKAQALLDIMQKLLDDQNTPNDLRNKVLGAVIRLCRASALYPQCLVLQDVQHGTESEACGSFGDIWVGSYKGHQVCLKVARTYRRQNVRDLFKIYVKEAVIWSQLDHPNLLPFYGIYHVQGASSGRVGLVSPWMQNGNIRDYLQANPEVPRRPLINEALAALGYLHTLKIVHGDIKGVNILVLPNGSACLADFGLASLLDTSSLFWTSVQTTSMTVGTLRWSAPELLDDDEGDDSPKPTFASDVYSMASTIYEILTDKIPFYELRLTATVVARVAQGFRPTKPPAEPELELSDGVWEVMWDCWSETPSERPTVDEIAKKLHEIPHNEVTIRRMAQRQNNNETQQFTPQDFRGAIRGGGPNASVAELDLLKEFSELASGAVVPGQ